MSRLDLSVESFLREYPDWQGVDHESLRIMARGAARSLHASWAVARDSSSAAVVDVDVMQVKGIIPTYRRWTV